MGYRALAKVYSIGRMATVFVVDRVDGYYIVEYNGRRCKAIYNPFVCLFYADDVFGILED